MQIILKTEIDLPDMLLTLPFGQRELILPAGLNVRAHPLFQLLATSATSM